MPKVVSLMSVIFSKYNTLKIDDDYYYSKITKQIWKC